MNAGPCATLRVSSLASHLCAFHSSLRDPSQDHSVRHDPTRSSRALVVPLATMS